MKCAVCLRKISRWDMDMRNKIIWDFTGVVICNYGLPSCALAFQEKIANFGRFLDLASCTLGLGYSLYKDGVLTNLKDKEDLVEETIEKGANYELVLVKKKR